VSQETVILAARSQQAATIAGKFFTVISATAEFQVDIGGRRRTVRTGSKLSDEPFDRILFIETKGVANTIVFDAGPEKYEGEAQVSGVSNTTFDNAYQPAGVSFTAAGLMTIPTATYTVLPVQITIGGVVYTRKSFHITNTDNGDDILIFDTSNNLLDVCLHLTDRTFYFADTVKLKSQGSAADIALYYTLFYSPPL